MPPSSHALQFTIHYSPPPNHTHCIECTCTLYCDSMIQWRWRLRTALLWHYCICLWALCIIQRTHAKQCKDLLLLYTHIHLRTACTRHMSAHMSMECQEKETGLQVSHRVHVELWSSGPQLVTDTTPPAANMTTGQWGCMYLMSVPYVYIACSDTRERQV